MHLPVPIFILSFSQEAGVTPDQQNNCPTPSIKIERMEEPSALSGNVFAHTTNKDRPNKEIPCSPPSRVSSTVPFLKTPTTNCKREIVVKTEKLQKIAIPIRTFISTWFRDSCFSFSIECTLHLSVCLLIQKMYLFNLSIKHHSASDMLKIKPFFCFFSAL